MSEHSVHSRTIVPIDDSRQATLVAGPTTVETCAVRVAAPPAVRPDTLPERAWSASCASALPGLTLCTFIERATLVSNCRQSGLCVRKDASGASSPRLTVSNGS